MKHGLGDWVPVNRAHMPSTLFTSSCYYYQAQRIAAEIAALKGLSAEAAQWNAKAAKTRAGLNRRLYKGDGVYDNGGQTAQAMALAFGLAEEAARAKVEAQLVAAVGKAGDHLDVGLYGTKHLFRALSRMGRTDLAFKLIVNPTKPSMAEWVQKGGTTLWEDWGDGSSRNHIMFGDFVGWAYQYLAGIRPAETKDSTSAVTCAKKPAFGEVVLAPQPIAALSWARASVDGPNGEIVSSWKREGDTVTYDFTVPPNTVAVIRLPARRRSGSVRGATRSRFRRMSPHDFAHVPLSWHPARADLAGGPVYLALAAALERDIASGAFRPARASRPSASWRTTWNSTSRR